MDHKGDIQYLRGGILSSHGSVVGFRSIHEAVGESLNLIKLQTKDRHRFKDFSHRTVDLAFAHHHPFLAVLNADLSLHIFEVSDKCVVKKYLSIKNWPAHPSHPNDGQPRLSWCPYVHGEDEDDEATHLVAVYMGCNLHIVNVGVLKDSELGDEMDFDDAENEDGGIFSHSFSNQAENKDFRIAAVCISPDSTAVAVATTEGPVQFYTFSDVGNTLTFAHCFEPRAFTLNGC